MGTLPTFSWKPYLVTRLCSLLTYIKRYFLREALSLFFPLITFRDALAFVYWLVWKTFLLDVCLWNILYRLINEQNFCPHNFTRAVGSARYIDILYICQECRRALVVHSSGPRLRYLWSEWRQMVACPQNNGEVTRVSSTLLRGWPGKRACSLCGG